jgi:amino acid permease
LQAFASLAPSNLPGDARFWVVFVGLVDLIVLLLMTRLDQLAPMSCAAIIPLMFFGGLTVYYGLHEHAGHDASGRNVNLWPESLDGILRALPILVFAFSYHTNVMPIYGDLCEPKRVNWTVAVVSAAVFSVAVCIFFGFMGAIQHPDTQGNILVDFGNTSLGAFTGFVISVAMVASIPLVAWQATHSMCSLVLLAKGPMDTTDSGKQDSESLVDDKRSTVCSATKVGFCIFMAMCTGIAVTVGDISKVIGLTGAVCGVPLVLSFPAAAYLAVSSEENTFQKCLALLTLMFSAVLWILGTYYTLIA